MTANLRLLLISLIVCLLSACASTPQRANPRPGMGKGSAKQLKHNRARRPSRSLASQGAANGKVYWQSLKAKAPAP